MSKAKQKIYYDGHYFDSPKEYEFYCWCEEAIRAGFINRFEYHPESFNLAERASVAIKKEYSSKSKVLNDFLSHPHKYTPDFIIYINPSFDTFKHGLFAMDEKTYYIDIKSSLREFAINRRWVWQKYGLFMNKLVLTEFFRKTFCPTRSVKAGTDQSQNKKKELAA